MKFRAEYLTTDPATTADLAVRAAASGATVLSHPGRVTIAFDRADHYDARTVALYVQGDAPTEARIRRDSAMFPGPWFDLNEE